MFIFDFYFFYAYNRSALIEINFLECDIFSFVQIDL